MGSVRSERFEVRVTIEERERWEAAAKAAGSRSVAQWMRDVLEAEASSVASIRLKPRVALPQTGGLCDPLRLGRLTPLNVDSVDRSVGAREVTPDPKPERKKK